MDAERQSVKTATTQTLDESGGKKVRMLRRGHRHERRDKKGAHLFQQQENGMEMEWNATHASLHVCE